MVRCIHEGHNSTTVIRATFARYICDGSSLVAEGSEEEEAVGGGDRRGPGGRVPRRFRSGTGGERLPRGRSAARAGGCGSRRATTPLRTGSAPPARTPARARRRPASGSRRRPRIPGPTATGTRPARASPLPGRRPPSAARSGARARARRRVGGVPRAASGPVPRIPRRCAWRASRPCASSRKRVPEAKRSPPENSRPSPDTTSPPSRRPATLRERGQPPEAARRQLERPFEPQPHPARGRAQVRERPRPLAGADPHPPRRPPGTRGRDVRAGPPGGGNRPSTGASAGP